MSKAEDRAQAAYPAWRNGIGDEFSSNSAYYGFIEGYHQAEKDNGLTWRDIAVINDIVTKMLNDCGDNILYDTEKDFCQEVLKRFKEEKEKIDN